MWMAYHHDWSSVVIFYNELDCLRYAVENHMEAAPIEPGVPIREQV